MAYTPDVDKKHSAGLRRIAWALKQPMTVAIKQVIAIIPYLIDRQEVCSKCRDKTDCERCLFNCTDSEQIRILNLTINNKALSLKPFPVIFLNSKKEEQIEGDK